MVVGRSLAKYRCRDTQYLVKMLVFEEENSKVFLVRVLFLPGGGGVIRANLLLCCVRCHAGHVTDHVMK